MANREELIQPDGSSEVPKERDPYLALKQGQFVPFFQPLVVLRTGQLAGFEVLARWQHPIQGLISPADFITIAERDGWIDALTHQILERAMLVVTALPNAGTISINISPVQLRDPSLPQQLSKMAANVGFPLSRLIVEVTESALIDNPESASAIIAELKAMGCRVALDDFGTGYSSLHHLQSLPFDMLKVDRSFVGSMSERRESRKIVAAVVGLGQSLGLTTVAEGIETQEQAEMMLWLGCELGQGYFYGEPIPADELSDSVSGHRTKTVTQNATACRTITALNLEVSPSQRLAQLQAVYDGAPVGLAFIDKNLRYVNLNKRLADMNGFSVTEHLGCHLSEMIPELFPFVEPYIRRALAGEVISDLEAKIPNTGETRLVSYQPALDEAGEVTGIVIAVTDITERNRMAVALKKSEAHYRSMVELNPEVLWIMDPQGRNLDVSPRWDSSSGSMKLQPANPEWLNAVHPEDLQATVRTIAEFRRTGSPIDVEYRVKADENSWQWKRSRGSPRFGSNGALVCWHGSVQDIDGPGQVGKRVLEFAAKRASVGTASHTATCAIESKVEESRNRVLMELELLDTPPDAAFDDLVALASEICAAPISLISLIDSQRQWFKASIGISACETPISSSFCAHAIQQQGLFMVEDATKDLRFMQNPLVVSDPHIRFYAGMPLYAGEGIAIGTLCVIDTVPRSLSAGQAKALAILSQQVQVRLELRSERRKLLRESRVNQELARRLEVGNKTLLKANAQLERLATTDALTGLLNRRVFEDTIHMEFLHAQRRARSLSLLVMDIDDFKKRNDQFGHSAGDDALRYVGEVLRKVLRVGDNAARIGGEEFAIILPEATPDQAGTVAKRVQELLGTGAADFPRITMSIGIACLSEDTDSWGGMLSRADLAMYDAKRTGKDKVVFYETQDVA